MRKGKIDSILSKLKKEEDQNKKLKVFDDILFLDAKTYENIRFLVRLYGWGKLTQNVPQWKELCRIINEIAELEKAKEATND